MKIYKEANYDEVSRVASEIIEQAMAKKPDLVLGLATGSTPVGTYEKLVKDYEAGKVDFSRVKTVNLDEYKGLSADNDQSYRYFMNDKLFDHVNIDKANTYIPDGMEADSQKACEDYERKLDELGAPDIQILGLGFNGHIGFNEPSDEFTKGTFCVDLTKSTIEANSRFFSSIDDVPKQAYTMGINTILRAKEIILIVTGEGKRDILKKALLGPVDPTVPASVLQTHSNVILIGDEAALDSNF